MSFWGRKKPVMTFEEELAVALRWVTMRRFASLRDDEQAEGLRKLARVLAIYADELEEGVL